MKINANYQAKNSRLNFSGRKCNRIQIGIWRWATHFAAGSWSLREIPLDSRLIFFRYQTWVKLALFLSWAYLLLGTHSMLGKIYFFWSKHFERRNLWLSAFIRLIFSSATLFLSRYNVYNAYVKVFGFPLAIAALQLGVGLLYAVPLWILGIRKMPKITFSDFMLLLPIGSLQNSPRSCRIASF